MSSPFLLYISFDPHFLKHLHSLAFVNIVSYFNTVFAFNIIDPEKKRLNVICSSESNPFSDVGLSIWSLWAEQVFLLESMFCWCDVTVTYICKQHARDGDWSVLPALLKKDLKRDNAYILCSHTVIPSPNPPMRDHIGKPTGLPTKLNIFHGCACQGLFRPQVLCTHSLHFPIANSVTTWTL